MYTTLSTVVSACLVSSLMCVSIFFLKMKVLNVVGKKQVEFYDVCYTECNVIYSIVTWLNGSSYDQNLFS